MGVRAVRTRVNSFVSFASRRVLHAAELFIIVAGQCETLSPSRDQPAEDLSLEDDGVTSIHDGTHFSPRFYSLAHNIQNLSPRLEKRVANPFAQRTISRDGLPLHVWSKIALDPASSLKELLKRRKE